MDDFQQSALRWLHDGHCLLAAERYGGASHAYGSGKTHEKPLYDGLRSALPVGANVVL